MNDEKKNQYIVITIVVILLAVVACLTILFIINSKNNNDIKVKIKQIYSSDYNLTMMGDYFIGTHDSNSINVIINKKGEEIYKKDDSIHYDNFYMLKDGNYLIYSNSNNTLKTYIFDGNDLNILYTINDVSNIKPLVVVNSYQEYIVGFISVTNDSTYIYNVFDDSVVIVNDSLLVADSISEDKYIVFSEKYLVMRNNTNLMGAINYSGKVIIPYKYKNLINTYNDSFIAQNDKELYGIISDKDEVLVKFNYSVIDLYENNYLLVNKKNKMSLYNKDYESIVSFDMDYDNLLGFDLRSNMNSIKLYKAGGRYYVINNYMEDVNKTAYDKHELYVINNNAIIDTIKQVGFNVSDFIYIYDEDYNIDIYDTDFNLLFNVKLDNVSKINEITYVSNKIIKVTYINDKEKETYKYYDLDGNEARFGLGELVLKSTDYLAYMRNNGNNIDFSIVDNNDIELDSITGNNMEINGNYLIVDNSIYEIVKKGN